MTEQEIEKLREKLGGDYSVKRQNGAITVELVDIWKGVEFAECVLRSESYSVGKIYPIYNEELPHVKTKFDDYGRPDNGQSIVYFKPSTEAAYVEQLKSNAKELYGEIKDGNRFDYSELCSGVCDETIDHMDEWTYYKNNDSLFTASEGRGGILIYRHGKWAKKVERVRVVPSEIHYPKPDNLDQYVTVELRVIGGILDASKSEGAAKELAKRLEDYLNKS